MKSARSVVIGVVLGVALGACKKEQPPQPVPQPVETADTVDTSGNDRAAADARARADAEARARAEAERARAALTEMVHFEYDASEIGPEAQDILVQKAAVLRAHPEIRLRISGHCDERGSVEYNLALGMRRAEAAKQFLVNYGLDGSRFETVSFGEERPIAQGEGEDAWAQNRRDEFQITAGESSLMPSGT